MDESGTKNVVEEKKQPTEDVKDQQSGIEDISDGEWTDDEESENNDFLSERTTQDLSDLKSSWMLPL